MTQVVGFRGKKKVRYAQKEFVLGRERLSEWEKKSCVWEETTVFSQWEGSHYSDRANLFM